MKILIVEDDLEISKLLADFLQGNGYEVLCQYDGLHVLDCIQEHQIDLILLDIMLPYRSGDTILADIRKFSTVPVIVISAKETTQNKIDLLRLGADDYITKPFTPMELLARVNSHLRRYHRFMDRLHSRAEESARIYRAGGLEVNEDTVSVTIDDRPVKVTPIEFKILLLLIRNPGRVFPADEIYERVWNERAINTDTVMVHIRNLREKIEVNPKEPKYLKVVWGVGYKIEKQP